MNEAPKFRVRDLDVSHFVNYLIKQDPNIGMFEDVLKVCLRKYKEGNADALLNADELHKVVIQSVSEEISSCIDEIVSRKEAYVQNKDGEDIISLPRSHKRKH